VTQRGKRKSHTTASFDDLVAIFTPSKRTSQQLTRQVRVIGRLKNHDTAAKWRQYPEGTLTEPFIEELEDRETALVRFRRSYPGQEPPPEESIAEAFYPELERNWTEATTRKFEEIFDALHAFHGTKPGDWKALAVALAIHNVPAVKSIQKLQPGRKPKTNAFHKKIVDYYDEVKAELGHKALEKQVFIEIAKRQNLRISQVTSKYYRAKKKLLV